MKIQGFAILLDGRQVYTTEAATTEDIEVYLSMKMASALGNFEVSEEVHVGSTIITRSPSISPGFEFLLLSGMHTHRKEREEILEKLVSLSEDLIGELGKERIISASFRMDYVRTVSMIIRDSNQETDHELMKRPKVDRGQRSL